MDNLFTRIKLAGKIMVKGTAVVKPAEREIPVITAEEVKEARIFFKREKQPC
jgi:hypothetical protein